MVTLKELYARQILDSRGNPTIEVDCLLSDDSFGRAAVPSGASTGTHEALELRDGDKSVYMGKSVQKAVSNVDIIAKELVGKDVSDQRNVDEVLLKMDGTDNKSKLGANAILGVSMAVCRARAVSEGKALWKSLADQYEVNNAPMMPTPLMNVLNGGKHADSGLSIQEFMIVPSEFSSFSEKLRAGVEIFHTLKKLLKENGHVTAVGDEGGFAPRLKTNREALELLMEAIKSAGYEDKVNLALDSAASEFYADGSYDVDGKKISSEDLTSYYKELVKDFPIISIEDSHSEDDWDGFISMQKEVGSSVQLVGDDLLVTNVKRIKDAIEKKAANAVLIKLNQIGSVTETVDAINLAKSSGWQSVISHRSGETEDVFISHLAVGLAAGQIKTGSLSRTDRICKYNELLRIEEKL
ncbi:phosphopyruvate hydratase [Candidatus Peribacteria bacterium]|jgi:enolase|nr:phosphopyruvate hydratase [Candidatus Peribacteria bacterium]MBT4021308.1 phosphopyruvate hydratase [Candidatus Peribacteria bacterium]MBT4241231.1 phosphopyruvate hydratase [Candidatus Peribacteria bacterium]MBT4474256.1 phosphopyruvate hydratase [Candidatus Peribacteria bacterium]